MNADKDIVTPIAFLALVAILNLIRWAFYKTTDYKQPKYMYWYLFVLAMFIAGLVPIFI